MIGDPSRNDGAPGATGGRAVERMRLYGLVNLSAMLVHGAGELAGWATCTRLAFGLMALATAMFLAADGVLLLRQRGEPR